MIQGNAVVPVLRTRLAKTGFLLRVKKITGFFGNHRCGDGQVSNSEEDIIEPAPSVSKPCRTFNTKNQITFFLLFFSLLLMEYIKVYETVDMHYTIIK